VRRSAAPRNDRLDHARSHRRSDGRPGRLHHRLPAVHERLLERYDQRAQGDDEGHVEDEALGSLVGQHRPARRQGHPDHGGGDYRERDEGPAITLRWCARTIVAPARAVKDGRSTSAASDRRAPLSPCWPRIRPPSPHPTGAAGECRHRGRLRRPRPHVPILVCVLLRYGTQLFPCPRMITPSRL
jgi:hypothetical protein